MKYLMSLLLLSYLGGNCIAQTKSMDQLQPDSSNYDNIYVHKLSSDSLASSFAIWIKLKVKMHKHVYHTEHVSILEGKGKFTLGDTTITVKKGDFITIPKDTWHGVNVTSKKPMKVISIQSPEFKGTDRLFKN